LNKLELTCNRQVIDVHVQSFTLIFNYYLGSSWSWSYGG